MRKTFAIYVTLSLVLTACASGTFEAGKPVTAEGNYFSRRITQGGKPIDGKKLMEALEANPKSAEKMSKAKPWLYSGLAAAVVGGYLIGYNLVGTRTDAKNSGLAGGAALFGVSLWLTYYADGYLVEAVDEYNNSLGKQKTSFQWVPMIFTSETAGGSPGLAMIVRF